MTLGKLTFKKEIPPGGLASVAWKPSTDIKLGGNIVDEILQISENWRIRFKVENPEFQDKTKENCNCPFKWITLKNSFATESEAREFVKAKVTEINERWKIYYRAMEN